MTYVRTTVNPDRRRDHGNLPGQFADQVHRGCGSFQSASDDPTGVLSFR